jgi:hypothetical protein
VAQFVTIPAVERTATWGNDTYLQIFLTEFNTFPWESVSIMVRSLTLEENPQA